MSLNGTNKSEAAIRLAIERGVRITLDSPGEVATVLALTSSGSRPALVRLRLRPGGETLAGPSDFSDRGESIAGLAAAYRPGFALADAERAARSIVDSGSVRLVGTHVHLGRHTTSLSTWSGVVSDHVRQIARISAVCGGWRPARSTSAVDTRSAAVPSDKRSRVAEPRRSRRRRSGTHRSSHRPCVPACGNTASTAKASRSNWSPDGPSTGRPAST
ncbi:hypothetical protein ACQEVZ_04425 [Dactylosporangium sp. CA-152071]|uniref:hypothetical protein n=1 Tax=Dactylosporangium sp. CA-152071 TaxID=3239933 RepID=UPI003D904BFB